MISAFKAWRAKRKAARVKSATESGYNFAAGKLLSMGYMKAEAYLSSCVETARAFDTFNEFDEGIIAALRDWETLHATR